MKIPTWFVKVLNWIEWICAGLGIVFMFLGFYSAIFGRFSNTESVNFFHGANSFFLLAIVLFLFIHLGQHKKE
jgi:hypothetical protein